MKIDIKYQNSVIGKIEYDSIVSFSRFCEENGFTLRWKLEDQTLLIMSGLDKQKVTVFREEKDESECQSKLISNFKHVLLDTGILIEERKGSDTLTEKNINIKWSDTINEDITVPKINIFYNLSPKHKAVKSFLENQLENLEVAFVSKKEKNNNLPSPTIILQCELPSDFKDLQIWSDKVSLGLAIGVCHYLCEKLNKSAQSFSPSCLMPFLHHDGENDVTENKEQHNPPPKTTEEKPDSSSESDLLPSKKDIDMEVFFDYTVYPSTSKNQFIVKGDLDMRNTGEGDLLNPLICIKVQPAELINVGGQILPPGSAGVLGVQSSSGMKGWKYMDSDWFEKAQDRGEYWIGPIDQLDIPAGESSALPHLQFTIEQPEEKTEAIIRGVIFFQDKNVSFPSNNDIRFSF